MGTATGNGIYRAIYPGSFDPFTNGHLDILDRTLKIFSEVTLVIADNAQKDPLFTVQEKVEIIREAIADRKNIKPNSIKIDTWSGLIMDYAKKHDIHAVIRGLRAASDFEYEFMMASMNKTINSEVETLFMMTSQDLYFVSSTMIKELFRYGGDITPYVPKLVAEKLKQKFPQQNKRDLK